MLFGGVLLALGHLFMAFEGQGGQDDPFINIFCISNELKSNTFKTLDSFTILKRVNRLKYYLLQL